MIKKQPYTAPEAETLEVKYEGIICDSGDFGVDPWTDPGTDPISF